LQRKFLGPTKKFQPFKRFGLQTLPSEPVTWLHDQRLDAVSLALRRNGSRTVLDLGCGEGPLLRRLSRQPDILRIVGLDRSVVALRALRAALEEEPQSIRKKVELIHGSFTLPDRSLVGLDAAILVETIEHIEPDTLSAMERAVFFELAPPTVIVTTPNKEFNPLLGVPRHRHRHPDHRFEWARPRFRSWATSLARRNEYEVEFEDVGGKHPLYGGASQMATFKRVARSQRPCPAAPAHTCSPGPSGYDLRSCMPIRASSADDKP